MPNRKNSPKAASDSRPQLDKFKEAARELQTDDSEEAFDRALKQVAKAPLPKPQDQKKVDS